MWTVKGGYGPNSKIFKKSKLLFNLFKKHNLLLNLKKIIKIKNLTN